MSALTREQIKAMRHADAAVLRFKLDEHGSALDATLELHKEVERPDGFGRETLRVSVDAPAIVHNYGNGFIAQQANATLTPANAGDWVLSSLSVRPEWQTLASFVRPGDELKQEWEIDGCSEALARVGATTHQLALRVQRPLKNGQAKVYSFILAAHAEPAHGYSSCVTRGARP